jgi:hypothetical protein
MISKQKNCKNKSSLLFTSTTSWFPLKIKIKMTIFFCKKKKDIIFYFIFLVFTLWFLGEGGPSSPEFGMSSGIKWFKFPQMQLRRIEPWSSLLNSVSITTWPTNIWLIWYNHKLFLFIKLICHPKFLIIWVIIKIH